MKTVKTKNSNVSVLEWPYNRRNQLVKSILDEMPHWPGERQGFTQPKRASYVEELEKALGKSRARRIKRNVETHNKSGQRIHDRSLKLYQAELKRRLEIARFGTENAVDKLVARIAGNK